MEKKTNYNYIKENYGEFINMIYSMIDKKPVENQIQRDKFKTIALPDYIHFLYNLNYLPIGKENILYQHQEYSNKLFLLCDKVYKNGLETVLPDDKVNSFCNMLEKMVKDWAHNELYLELKTQEKEYYTKLSFNKEVSAQTQYRDRINQLKNQTEKNFKW